MRILLVSVAALALVAGCKGKEPAADPAATEAAATASVAATLPAVPADAKGTVTLAGSYSQTGADGKTATVKLNADNSYEWTDADGKVLKGKLSWYKDGQRILLLGDAGNAVFAVADGGIYKLADKDAPVAGLTAEQLWKKLP